MQNSRLYQVLDTFDQRERKQFRKFLESPFHNQRQEIRDLYEVLLSFSKPEERDKEALWKKLHPGQAFRYARLRHIMSELLELANDFLAWTALQSEPDRRQFQVSKQYLARGLDQLVHSNWKKRNAGKRERLFRVENALQDFEWAQLMAGLGPSFGRKQEEDISRHFEGLDEWIVLQKLRQAMSYASHQRLFESDSPFSEVRYWEGIQSEISPEWRLRFPLLELFEAATKLLALQDEASFFHLRELLDRHGPGIHPTELRTLYLIAINFCVKQLNFGQDRFTPILFDIYLNGLATSWLFEKGKLSPWTYKNIVSVGLKLERYDQIEAFIEAYRDHLPEEYRHDYSQHANAELYFAKGEYRRVLRTMRHIHLKDPITRMRYRIIQIKACYELREVSLLESQIDNFLQFLRWEKHSAYHKQHYSDFVSNIRQLIRLPPGSEKAAQAFLSHLSSSNGFIEKKWLMEKVSEMA